MNVIQSLGRGGRVGPYRLLEEIGAGGMARVYRARDDQSGELVALKLVLIRDVPRVRALGREIAALGRLRHRGVVRIVDSGLDGGQPWLAMEEIAGPTLRERFQARPDWRFVIGVVRALAETLSYVHDAGIVHRDLKPSNIVLKDGVAPVLVDFGLMVEVEPDGRARAELRRRLEGTYGYMSPEQQRGAPTDARGDLYSLGCLLYEGLAGRLPFPDGYEEEQGDPQALTPISRQRPEIPAAIDDLVAGLLAPRAGDRIGYAADVARALDPLLEGTPPASPRSPSYLYLPRLAGRDELVADLVLRARRARGGAVGGGVTLLRGPSGGGKSRVLGEVIARIGESMAVVVGECSPTRRSPLAPLSSLLTLIAATCSEDAERAAALLAGSGPLLAAFSPEIAELPSGRGPAPVELPPQAARERLLFALVELLQRFTQIQPLLLVLDDLQWADELTLALLDRLATPPAATADDRARPRRLAVLAACRADERGEAIMALSAVRGVATIDLPRLDDQTLAGVACDLLAVREAPAELIRFVTDRAAGSPFFVGEYLRTAVAEGLLERTGIGRWVIKPGALEAELGRLPLPAGIEAIVERRLAGLPADARHLAQAGAVLGREMDASLLLAISRLDGAPALAALSQLLARAVLEETAPSQVRFLHDRLREAAYPSADPALGRQLHGRAALEIERRTLPAGVPARAAELAHHFTVAGDTANAIRYLERAGEFALDSGAHAEAWRQLDQARRLIVEETRQPPASPTQRERIDRLLADACFGLGELAEAERHLRAALASTLDRPLPARPLGWLRLLGGQAVAAAIGRLPGSARPDPVALENGALAASRLAELAYFADDAGTLTGAALLAVALARRAPARVRVSRPYAQLAWMAGAMRFEGLARRAFDHAEALARDLGDAGGGAYSGYTRALHHLGRGEWERAERCARRASDGATGAGDHQDAEIAMTMLGHAEFYRGRVEAARIRFVALAASAATRRNPQHEAWGHYAAARSLLVQGRSDEALGLLARAEQRLGEAGRATGDRASALIIAGLTAAAHAARGDVAAAAQKCDQSRPLIAAAQPTVFSMVDGLSAFAETRLWLLGREGETGAQGEPSGDGWRETRLVVRRLAAFAVMFPMAQPAALRAVAGLAERRGLPVAARLARALGGRAARRGGMVIEAAAAGVGGSIYIRSGAPLPEATSEPAQLPTQEEAGEGEPR